jgi:hypothetical protein
MIITGLTFRDLKKRVSLETVAQQQSNPLERLQNKPFWIWNKEEHRQQDIKTRDINELMQKLSHNYNLGIDL